MNVIPRQQETNNEKEKIYIHYLLSNLCWIHYFHDDEGQNVIPSKDQIHSCLSKLWWILAYIVQGRIPIAYLFFIVRNYLLCVCVCVCHICCPFGDRLYIRFQSGHCISSSPSDSCIFQVHCLQREKKKNNKITRTSVPCRNRIPGNKVLGV
jgi:hypothetical protein